MGQERAKLGREEQSYLAQAREGPRMRKHVLQLFKEALRRLAIKSDTWRLG